MPVFTENSKASLLLYINSAQSFIRPANSLLFEDYLAKFINNKGLGIFGTKISSKKNKIPKTRDKEFLTDSWRDG